jgi:hypothetical protein
VYNPSVRCLAAIVFTIVIGVGRAGACSCPERTLSQNFASAQSVFLGQITAARHVPATSTVDIDVNVIEIFKGDTAHGGRRVITFDSEAICGIAVVVPRQFVFFVDRQGIVSRCFGSFQLNKAAKFESRVRRVREFASRHKR